VIDKAAAKKQVARLSQMYGYPRGEDQKAALEELVIALQPASSEEMARNVVSSILDMATSESRCPMPAALRIAVYDAAERTATRRKCNLCEGIGFIPVSVLVTYRSTGSFDIVKSEHLTQYSYEEVIEFRKKLGPLQDILSAASPCSCLPATHHARTAA